MSEILIKAISEMKEQEAIQIAKDLLESGEDPMSILDDSSAAMEIVGKRFESGEYFLPHLMMAGEILKQISEIVKPSLTGTAQKKKLGKVIIGTVKGDIHDIGKNIVTFMLNVNGFDVRDIGIDVPPNKFVEEIKEFKPKVVGMSGLLTLAYDSMKDTVDAIVEAGLRDDIKIMIGGGQMSEKVCVFAGADAYAKDALEGVSLAKKWIDVQ
ncbi:B12-binding domain-containing protein [Thermodesulfobacteriota bacterium]